MRFDSNLTDLARSRGMKLICKLNKNVFGEEPGMGSSTPELLSDMKQLARARWVNEDA
jgi:hypothetical protein